MKIDSENSQHFSKIKFFGINNVIFLDDEFQFFDNMTISISGDNNTIKIAQVKITQRGKLNIHISGNNNNIEIGDAVIINHNMSLSFFAGGIGASANNCSIKISSKSFFNGNISLICGEENTHISIGEDCLFANNIKLTTTDNHSIYDLSNGERVNKGGDVRIGNHCWICEDVTFLNNSSVADNCVVATKSLVTKPLLSSYCCYGGIPAIIIRKNINWNREIRNYWGGGQNKFAA
ncbi:acyltransferase [Helicobacter mesocricetorum]|uniref:acyltransferase n=1 Tax=Helicobacter mesocricetorum TaxID=87012 RepID=UPI000CF1A07F|nr:hypothetical protein [Helicobacter mesocricetorum]